MKLYSVEVWDDMDIENILVVAEDEKSAERIVADMDWSCLLRCAARELDEVDGYSIILKKR